MVEKGQVILEVGANLFRGREAVGGKLKITDERLIFESHAINIQTGKTEILISEIAEVKKRKTLLIVPNGMLVTTKNNIQYKFVLFNTQKVINLINEIINKHN